MRGGTCSARNRSPSSGLSCSKAVSFLLQTNASETVWKGLFSSFWGCFRSSRSSGSANYVNSSGRQPSDADHMEPGNESIYSTVICAPLALTIINQRLGKRRHFTINKDPNHNSCNLFTSEAHDWDSSRSNWKRDLQVQLQHPRKFPLHSATTQLIHMKQEIFTLSAMSAVEMF